MQIVRLFTATLFFFSSIAAAQNVITVSATGGDFSDPADALDAIGTTLPSASAANRYLVRILPGRYQVNRPVDMQPYVDLEGSGIHTTLIRGTIPWNFGGDIDNNQGVINAASRSEIRHLTIRNTETSVSAIGIGIFGTRGTRITDVRSVARGGADSSAAWKYGIRVQNSTNLQIHRAISRGTTSESTLCQGITLRNSAATISNSRLVARNCTIALGLVVDDGSDVIVRDSTMIGEGSINGISVSAADGIEGSETLLSVRDSILIGQVSEGVPDEVGFSEIRISHSELTGSVSGSPKCFASHDPLLNVLTSTCVPAP
ncbi:MAG: hypothetical protein AAF402_13760 [Pseudomonadota bacterium]